MIVLAISTRYEGEEIIGVYSSQEEAEAAATQYESQKGNLSENQQFAYLEFELNAPAA
jgi:hypothetical protein